MSQMANQLPDLAIQVTVFLDNEQSQPAEFAVPQSLLVESSGFFQAECRKDLGTADRRVIHLTGVEPDVFNYYLLSVYRQQAVFAKYEPSELDVPKKGCCSLVKLWLLADRLENNQLCNDVADAIVETIDGFRNVDPTSMLPPSMIVLVWSTTTADCALRRLILDYYYNYTWVRQIKAQIEHFHVGFYKDLLMMALQRLEDDRLEKCLLGDTVSRNRCVYHDHEDQQPTESCAAKKGGTYSEAMCENETLRRDVDLTKQVTIVINENDPQHVATFAVPEYVLAERSECFKAACRNGWKEDTTRVIRIPDVDSDAFYMYIQCAYREEIALRPWSNMVFHTMAEAEPPLNDLVQLWLLSDRLSNTWLRNRTMDTLRMIAKTLAEKNCVNGWTKAFTPDAICHIWAATTRGRALRRFMVDVYESQVSVEEPDRVRDECHPEFLADLLIITMQRRNGRMNKLFNQRRGCHYHEHDEGEE